MTAVMSVKDWRFRTIAGDGIDMMILFPCSFPMGYCLSTHWKKAYKSFEEMT